MAVGQPGSSCTSSAWPTWRSDDSPKKTQKSFFFKFFISNHTSNCQHTTSKINMKSHIYRNSSERTPKSLQETRCLHPCTSVFDFPHAPKQVWNKWIVQTNYVNIDFEMNMSVACIGYLIWYVFNSLGSHSTLEIILLFVISRVETLTKQHIKQVYFAS